MLLTQYKQVEVRSHMQQVMIPALSKPTLLQERMQFEDRMLPSQSCMKKYSMFDSVTHCAPSDNAPHCERKIHLHKDKHVIMIAGQTCISRSPRSWSHLSFSYCVGSGWNRTGVKKRLDLRLQKVCHGWPHKPISPDHFWDTSKDSKTPWEISWSEMLPDTKLWQRNFPIS